MHDLAALYAEARVFTALKQEAEQTWRPGLMSLSSSLRAAMRTNRAGGAFLSAAELDACAKQILALQEAWLARINAQRDSAAYQRALHAMKEERWAELERLLPEVFSDLSPAPQATLVYLPLDASQPGARHRKRFRAPDECANWLEGLLANGVPPEEGEAWWFQDFPYLQAAARPDSILLPLWLQAPRSSVHGAVLLDHCDPGVLRIYGPSVRAPWVVGVAQSTEDEWWLSQTDSFTEYRLALLHELEKRRIPVVSLSM